jgi:hypothetical protein
MHLSLKINEARLPGVDATLRQVRRVVASFYIGSDVVQDL